MTLRVKTDTKDGSIEKVTEAQECNRLSEQDVTVLRERWGYNEMEEKKRNKFFQFLKHFWRPMPNMIWLAILIEALQFDWNGFCGALCIASHQRSLRLKQGIEGFRRDRGIEESGAKESREVEFHGLMV